MPVFKKLMPIIHKLKPKMFMRDYPKLYTSNPYGAPQQTRQKHPVLFSAHIQQQLTGIAFPQRTVSRHHHASEEMEILRHVYLLKARALQKAACSYEDILSRFQPPQGILKRIYHKCKKPTSQQPPFAKTLRIDRRFLRATLRRVLGRLDKLPPEVSHIFCIIQGCSLPESNDRYKAASDDCILHIALSLKDKI